MKKFISYIARLRNITLFQFFTIYTRYLVGSSFIHAAFAMGKIQNEPTNLAWYQTTPLEQLEPMQLLFKVLAESGIYWQFIGWTQLIGGFMLMSQRWAKMGAIIFFVLILNIFVITISFNFKGTPFITGIMLLATMYLLVWDLRGFQGIFLDAYTFTRQKLVVHDHPFWSWLGILMASSITVTGFIYRNILIDLGIVFVFGLLGLLVFVIPRRKTIFSGWVTTNSEELEVNKKGERTDEKQT